MQMCFTLTPIGKKEAEPLPSVDTRMKEHFNTPVYQENWYENWYETIGLALALGHDWGKVKELFPMKAEIVDWLKENYTVDSWEE